MAKRDFKALALKKIEAYRQSRADKICKARVEIQEEDEEVRKGWVDPERNPNWLKEYLQKCAPIDYFFTLSNSLYNPDEKFLKRMLGYFIILTESESAATKYTLTLLNFLQEQIQHLYEGGAIKLTVDGPFIFEHEKGEMPHISIPAHERGMFRDIIRDCLPLKIVYEPGLRRVGYIKLKGTSDDIRYPF